MVKKILALLMTAAMFTFTGCEDLPDADTVKGIANTCGAAAGYACQFTSLDAGTKATILEVMDVVEKITPAESQTFTEAWTPVINEEIEKLVAASKLPEKNKAIVKAAATAMTTGLDYLFKKHPKWKTQEELVVAAIDGFCDGFKNVVGTGFAKGDVKYDKDCYDAVQLKLSK